MIQKLAQGIVPYIAFVLLAVLILDIYVFPKKVSKEIVDNGTIDGGPKRSTETFYLLTKTGNKYRVTETLFNTILIEQEIGIYRTFLFRRVSKISWCETDGTCYSQDIGAFIHGVFEYLMLGGLCLVSLLSASGILKLYWINNYVLLCLSAGIFAYYLVF
jgi:hypothetical protein